MLSLGSWKVKLVYAGLGSLFGCVFTIMGMLALPVTAQDLYRSPVECTELRVVNEAGETKVLLSIDEVFDNGVVRVYGNNGKSEASLSVTKHGGVVTALGADGKSKAVLGINADGGFVRVTGRSKGEVFAGLDTIGGGRITTKDRNGYHK